ncbi:unnamed protein product [Urochloa decumbens]|uniref:EGF-like domain-containing protein n=1 Tax=Urochloa decumbens TaxID=240449 RepID=A0ABC8WWT7_9POAL
MAAVVLARAVSTATEPLRLVLVITLLACAAAAGAPYCETASCGRGNCTDVPEVLPYVPNYECHCEPGWSHALDTIPFSPCVVPNCSFDGACLNLTLARPTGIPKDACDIVTCGKRGACKTGGDAGTALFSYSCECQPGYANLLNLTTLPCVNNCFFGNKGCSALGLGPAPPSQPSPSLSPPPSSGASAPPSGTKGSVPSRRLLQLLLLAIMLTMAHV